MRKTDIQAGAEVYYAKAEYWRSGPPTKAVIVDPAPHRIIRQRFGPFYLVSHQPDPAGTAILVDLHHGDRVEREAVPVRHLRGLWAPTLAKLGKTEADVKAYWARIDHLASQPGPLTTTGLLQLAASDPDLPDDGFTALRQAAEGQPITGREGA